jgi:putative CocE/NonD family hydrolase
MEAIHLAWFDWTLRGGPKPEFLRDRVAYWVMESEEWRFGPSLEDVAPGRQEWFLDSAGDASDVFHSGTLSPDPRPGDQADNMVYNPLDTSVEVESTGSYLEGGLAYSPGPKSVYHSSPFPDSLTVAGYVTAELYVELDVPDTDLLAGLYEIRADGTSLYLGQSELRARHRNGVDRSESVIPGSVERYTFDRFYWFSRTLLPGSRIRLVVTPLDTPDRDKNYNSGGNTIEETGADARTASIRIHHGERYPSRLILPTGG